MQNVQKENYVVSNFFIFFIIISSINGTGLLGFQNILAKNARHDGWIVVMSIGISILLILWLIYKLLQGESSDIIAVHNDIFGKFIGSVLSVIISIYFLSVSIFVFRTYLEIVRVWAFPSVSIIELGVLMLIIIYYIVSGGFRVVTGICFMFALIPSLLFLFSLFFPLKFVHLNNLSPILNLSFSDFISGFKESSSIYFGFETLLIYYPLLKNGKSSKKWANYAIIYIIFLFTIVTLISFTYFSIGQLINSKWPTLEMIKIIELPFVERFEFIFVFSWLAVIIPTICLHLWSVCRIYKRLFDIKPRISLVISLGIVLMSTVGIDNYLKLEKVNNYVYASGFYFVYFYIPLIFVVNIVRNMIRKKLRNTKK
ncbi:GerAB/ArcD/ProY family transporter [Neobacillus sp. DY30]|uniref:GerAB/ArcD/ProY family transporter n=1 Tax=Neobacillus sp. DY30 TaxID=3047871 RepID=UPI0024BFDF4E|nr:GerAB/ArcD/ProY family transporter [Neobacillus sp. DY30]WHY00487.1 GerAB/ArcD/ProY family transporter [Neobacillus sp. DY30]